MTNKFEPRMSLITLGVSDLVRATEFYQQGLGFPLAQHSNEHVSFFELAHVWLGLFPKTELAKDATVPIIDSGYASFTIAHNVTTKEQVDMCLEIAKQAGATIIKPAAEVFWGGYSGYFADLDQHLWEVAFNPHFWIE